MEERIEKALENHSKGYNCAQAVACAFCDLVSMDENTLFKITEGFGAGMGGMQCTCGAISGAIALAGLKESSGDTDNPTTKGKTYKLSKEIVEEFREKNSSVICRELKGIDTNKVLRSCDGCIEDAAKIAYKVLFK
ncbi:MAG: C-GCAxxG-C-C family protein [Clostridiales bacterium]|nr:C-GCAxxG-C-C family protein [Clostridiales bacterium]MDY2729005.1 C-GCAxxG-C-C family protein [Clostridium sp.]NLK23985.1 C_GCAxxG_C_C family protein [Clostridiales bacterium]